MTPYSTPPFYHPPFYSPTMAAPGHVAAQMLPWGFSTNNLMNGVLPSTTPLGGAAATTAVSQQPKLLTNLNIEEWCNKHNLGVKEYNGLVKLGFRLDKPEELYGLDEATWASVGLGLLHQHRIKAACAAGN